VKAAVVVGAVMGESDGGRGRGTIRSGAGGGV
jgi:hypothetical protein